MSSYSPAATPRLLAALPPGAFRRPADTRGVGQRIRQGRRPGRRRQWRHHPLSARQHRLVRYQRHSGHRLDRRRSPGPASTPSATWYGVGRRRPVGGRSGALRRRRCQHRRQGAEVPQQERAPDRRRDRGDRQARRPSGLGAVGGARTGPGRLQDTEIQRRQRRGDPKTRGRPVRRGPHRRCVEPQPGGGGEPHRLRQHLAEGGGRGRRRRRDGHRNSDATDLLQADSRLRPGPAQRSVGLDGGAHEVKSGYVALRSRIRRQIEKDKALLADPDSGVAAYTWHFVASGRSDSLGADPAVLDLLDEAGIGYVIHLP
jgi:hypothetical protein